MGNICFDPFPILTTERLFLRRLEPSDAEGIFALRSNEEVIRYTGIKQYGTIDEATAYIHRIDEGLKNNACIMWSIILKESHIFMGSICYWNITQDGTCAEIGYDLLPAFQGKGFMQEAIKEVLRHGFEKLKLEKVVAEPRRDNIRSVMLLERSGFTRCRRYEGKENGEPVEMVHYAIKAADIL